MDVIFFALIVGLICGAIPAITGAAKGRIGLGLFGFLACTVSGLVLGLLLAIPMAALFVYLIFKKDRDASKNQPSA